jgi:uncharacterized RDD family membrane protein YckC
MADLDHGPARKIVPIPMLTPVRSAAKRNSARSHSPRPASNRGLASAQQPFDFSTELPDAVKTAKMDAVIYCDAAVALPIHRMMAAAVDASMIAVALGIFLAVFYFSGGSITWSKQTALILVGVAGALTQLYRLLWCLADGDTPGMRFAGLRLVNFDGRPPGREQRGVRQAAYLLSVLSAGLGLIWALVDEENLTWHDHISKTFPTPN